MIRKIFFWAHLVAGFSAGVFVLLMSLTGVLLTYESQIVDFAVARAIDVQADQEPLGRDALVAAALAGGALPGQSIVLPRAENAPARLVVGRSTIALNPFTGARLDEAGAAAREFFSKVTALHRWLSLSGRTGVGGTLLDASNLIFLFLIVTGLYLWLPRMFRWTLLKVRLVFRRGLPNAQARHYNWHHVFGIWAAIPLFFIVLSGVVFSYSWANNLVFTLVGEDAPQGRGRRGGGDAELPADLQNATLSGTPLSYDALLSEASAELPNWRRAIIVLPQPDAGVLQLTLDEGNGVQNAASKELAVDRVSGDIVAEQPEAQNTLGSRLRRWLRFVHTGEIYGVLGQTITGLASLAAIVMVYTGFSLGIRRLARMWRQRQVARSA